jgi:hypothetical protein
MRTGSALSGSSERDTHRGDLALEGAGARPARRHDAVGYQEPCDPARPIKVADRSERVFLLEPCCATEPDAQRGLLSCIVRFIDERHGGQIAKRYMNELAVAYVS